MSYFSVIHDPEWCSVYLHSCRTSLVSKLNKINLAVCPYFHRGRLRHVFRGNGKGSENIYQPDLAQEQSNQPEADRREQISEADPGEAAQVKTISDAGSSEENILPSSPINGREKHVLASCRGAIYCVLKSRIAQWPT